MSNRRGWRVSGEVGQMVATQLFLGEKHEAKKAL